MDPGPTRVAYYALHFVGIGLSSLLLLTFLIGKLRRHALVISFLFFSILAEVVALLCLFGHTWSATIQTSSLPPGGVGAVSSSTIEDPTTLRICLTNAILGNVCWTAVVAHTVSFSGEIYHVVSRVVSTTDTDEGRNGSKVELPKSPYRFSKALERQQQQQPKSFEDIYLPPFQREMTLHKELELRKDERPSLEMDNVHYQVHNNIVLPFPVSSPPPPTTISSDLGRPKTKRLLPVGPTDPETLSRMETLLLCVLPLILASIIGIASLVQAIRKPAVQADPYKCSLMDQSLNWTIAIIDLLSLASGFCLFGMTIFVVTRLHRKTRKETFSKLSVGFLIRTSCLALIAAIGGGLEATLALLQVSPSHNWLLDIYFAALPVASCLLFISSETLNVWSRAIETVSMMIGVGVKRKRPRRWGCRTGGEEEDENRDLEGKWKPPPPSYKRKRQLLSLTSSMIRSSSPFSFSSSNSLGEKSPTTTTIKRSPSPSLSTTTMRMSDLGTSHPLPPASSIFHLSLPAANTSDETIVTRPNSMVVSGNEKVSSPPLWLGYSDKGEIHVSPRSPYSRSSYLSTVPSSTRYRLSIASSVRSNRVIRFEDEAATNPGRVKDGSLYSRESRPAALMLTPPPVPSIGLLPIEQSLNQQHRLRASTLPSSNPSQISNRKTPFLKHRSAFGLPPNPRPHARSTVFPPSSLTSNPTLASGGGVVI